jgi:tetratricopeptide (TPR) repeat protein
LRIFRQAGHCQAGHWKYTVAFDAGTWLVAIAIAATLAGDAAASVKSEIAFHRGVVAFGDGQYDEAKLAFEIVLAEDPEDTGAIQYLGLIAAEQGKPDEAVALYRRALAIDPDDVDFHFDLGAALLETNQAGAARTEFDTVLAAQPDRARAHLFAGISAYRDAAYRDALTHLARAEELDASLKSQARYYTGLSQAHLQDFPAAAGAFADAEQSPLSPLSQSARNLRAQVTPEPEHRRWDLSLTAGLEYDSNPTLAGETLDRNDDGRGVYRIRGRVSLFEDEHYALAAGYDGYLSTHFNETFVDLQTHVGYVSARANFDPVQVGLRYDYAYTWLDLDREFRGLHRVTPTLGVREQSWGFSQLFYQLQLQQFYFSRPASLEETDRDGERHTVGFNQFLFPGDYLPDYLPITYFRVGAVGDFQNTDGTEFRFDSWEFSFGLGAELPWGVQLSLLYRLTDRGYRKNSIFDDAGGLASSGQPTGEVRDDLQNRLTFELTKPVTENWQISAAGSFTFNDSDVPLYDYNRSVIGAYLTYGF